MAKIISKIVRERLRCRIQDLFVFDATPVNKAAVRKFIVVVTG